MSETISKLQPNRTMSLRGFDSLGASAALHSATATGFQISGIFRDPADFAVLLLWDADNFYEHPHLKYLPDFNFTGAVLTFDAAYTPGLQPLDSPKFNWIDWATLDCIRPDGSTTQIRLWDHAALNSTAFPAATGAFHLVTGPTGIQAFDRVTLFFQNLSYDFIAPIQNNSVEYQFFAAGFGTSHTITVSGRTYTHIESNLAGESSADVANALVALMPGDPQVAASIGSLAYSVLLAVKPGQTAAGIPVTATGNVGTTLGATSLNDVALALAQEIDSTDWWTAIPTHALRATANGASITVTAARYGTLATAGTSVTWLSGTLFTGIVPASAIMIAGVNYIVASVNNPKSLTLAASAGTQASAQYVADRGGVDGNMIELYALNKTDSLKTAQSSVRLSGGDSTATWRCTLDFTALGIDRLRQCWLTFAPALANSQAYTATEWQATFSNWTLTDPNAVLPLSVAGPNSVRVEETSTACVYTGAWAATAPETGFYSGGLAKRAGSPTAITNETVTIRYSCAHVHDLYLGTSLYIDRATVGAQLDGDPETDLNCFLQTEASVNTRRRLRQGVPAGAHTVRLRMKSTGYFYLDFIQAAVLSSIPALPDARSNIAPALDYSTDHSYKLPPARIMWIFDNLGFTGPVNQYIGVFWWNQRTNTTAQFPSSTVAFNGAWASGDTAQLTIGGTSLSKAVLPADTTSTIAAHFARYINEVFVGAWAQASGNTLTITSRSPAYTFTFTHTASSTAGTIAVTGSLQGGSMGTWVVDPTQLPALNRGARDWHADLYAECKSRNREIVTSNSMELVNPPAGFAAIFPDGQPAITDVGFGNLRSTHCAQSSPMLAYQKSVFDSITDLQNAAGLVPNIQFGEYLWWFFTNYSAAANTSGGMAYCDAETLAAAQTALGRPLHRFLDPNDAPTVNGSADAIFLRNRLRDHVAALATHTRARYPNAQCEMLFAYDVNYPTPANGVGGALNNFINFPVEWGSHTTAGFDRLKLEALSFGGNSRNLTLARTAIEFPLHLDWPLASLRYLVPIFIAGSTWEKEVAIAFSRHIPVVNLWAFDQMCIFGLKIAAPRNQSRSTAFGM
jgi:hypothetical protein